MTSLTGLVGELIELGSIDGVLDPEPLRNALREAAGTFTGLTGITDVGMKLRTHGDFHLGQVLHTGEDLVFIDFEGDNSRPLTERLIKTSPLADVASMIHSFRYAAASIAHRDVAGPFAWHERMPHLKQRTNVWFRTVTAAFLGEYRARLAGSTVVPSDKTDYERMLRVYLLAKAVYQLAYELRHRPDWIAVASETFLEIAADTTSAG
jgi:maltose alpha-D-glucosyltransferase/alpha-amylase